MEARCLLCVPIVISVLLLTFILIKISNKPLKTCDVWTWAWMAGAGFCTIVGGVLV